MSKTTASKRIESLTSATPDPDVVNVPPRRALEIEGFGAPGGEMFRRSIQALYGVAYTMKFDRKKSGTGDIPIAALEGDWLLQEGGAPSDPDTWRWRLRLTMPDDVTAADVRRAVHAVTTKKGGKLEGSVDARRVQLHRVPRKRYGRILHVGPYATETASIERLEALLRDRGLSRRPWHTEVYLSDPKRTAPDRLKTVLLVELDRAP